MNLSILRFESRKIKILNKIEALLNQVFVKIKQLIFIVL